MVENTFFAARAKLPPELGRARQLIYCQGERGDVIKRHGHKHALPIIDLKHRRYRASDRRHSGGHGLEQAVRHAFPVAGKCEYVGGVEILPDRLRRASRE